MKNDGANPPGSNQYGIIDMNCHILPGIDNGAKNMRETTEMLKIAYEEGIRTIIATPHYNNEYTMTDTEKLTGLMEQVQKAAAQIDPEFKIYLGRKILYSMDAHEKLMTGELKTMVGSRYVLLNFQHTVDFKSVRKAVRDIIMDGYIPIVAHVEQYENIAPDIEKVEGLIQRGAYIQINAKSVTGDMGHDLKDFTKKLLKHQLVHFVATDAHDAEEQAPYIKECAEYIEKKYGLDYMNELLICNPRAIIENDDIDI